MCTLVLGCRNGKCDTDGHHPSQDAHSCVYVWNWHAATHSWTSSHTIIRIICATWTCCSILVETVYSLLGIKFLRVTVYSTYIAQVTYGTFWCETPSIVRSCCYSGCILLLICCSFSTSKEWNSPSHSIIWFHVQFRGHGAHLTFKAVAQRYDFFDKMEVCGWAECVPWKGQPWFLLNGKTRFSDVFETNWQHIQYHFIITGINIDFCIHCCFVLKQILGNEFPIQTQVCLLVLNQSLGNHDTLFMTESKNKFILIGIRKKTKIPWNICETKSSTFFN